MQNQDDIFVHYIALKGFLNLMLYIVFLLKLISKIHLLYYNEFPTPTITIDSRIKVIPTRKVRKVFLDTPDHSFR